MNRRRLLRQPRSSPARVPPRRRPPGPWRLPGSSACPAEENPDSGPYRVRAAGQQSWGARGAWLTQSREPPNRSRLREPDRFGSAGANGRPARETGRTSPGKTRNQRRSGRVLSPPAASTGEHPPGGFRGGRGRVGRTRRRADPLGGRVVKGTCGIQSSRRRA